MIETIRQGLKEEGFTVLISKRCQWFAIPRRTLYYKSTKAAPRVDPKLAEPIKAMIEESPSFGYRTVAHLLAHRHRFESLQHASRVIGDWIRFYNHRRPH